MIDEPLIYSTSKSKHWFGLIASAAFVLCGVWLVTSDWEAGRQTRALIGGYGCIAFFGLAIPFFLFRLILNPTPLVVDQKGLTIRTTAFPVGFIAWHEIETIEVVQTPGRMGGSYIGIKPKDLNKILQRPGPMQSLMLRLNGSLSHAPIAIPSIAIDAGQDALAVRLNEFLAASRKGD